MEKESNKRPMTYVISNTAKMDLGYNLAQTKDGKVFAYTACQEGDVEIEDFKGYSWPDKQIVHQCNEDEIIAIKRFDYQNGTVEMIQFPNGNRDFKFNIEEEDKGLMINNFRKIMLKETPHENYVYKKNKY